MFLSNSSRPFFMVAMLLVPCERLGVAAEPQGERLAPLHRVVDLDVGESQSIEFSDGKRVAVKLIELRETRDPIRDAVREALVKVEVDGRGVELVSGNYNLPKTVGNVQIDCSITKGYNSNGSPESWALDKDARLRLWPAGSPLVQPGTFGYPAVQRWFAGLTQMANEPVYVDGGERPQTKKIYYHSGLDIGGAEGMVEVVAATDGLVVSSGLEVLPEHRQDTPVSPRYDVVYLLDARGWYYRYSHMKEIDATVKPGRHLKLGDRIGSLGKEGGSGGWSHLHFEIKSRQPSGAGGPRRATPSCGKRISGSITTRDCRCPPAPRDLGRRAGAAGWIEVLQPPQRGEPRVDVSRRHDGTRPERDAELCAARLVQRGPQGQGRAGPPQLRLRHRAGVGPRASRSHPADDPPGVLSHAGHSRRRRRDLQSPHVPHDRRSRGLGLRGRQPDRAGPLRRQRETVGSRRLRGDNAPVREAGTLSRAGRAIQPLGHEGHRPPRCAGSGASRRRDSLDRADEASACPLQRHTGDSGLIRRFDHRLIGFLGAAARRAEGDAAGDGRGGTRWSRLIRSRSAGPSGAGRSLATRDG